MSYIAFWIFFQTDYFFSIIFTFKLHHHSPTWFSCHEKLVLLSLGYSAWNRRQLLLSPFMKIKKPVKVQIQYWFQISWGAEQLKEIFPLDSVWSIHCLTNLICQADFHTQPPKLDPELKIRAMVGTHPHTHTPDLSRSNQLMQSTKIWK